MSNEKTPYLCGGVFFFLLLQAVLPNGSARDHRAGIKDEHKAPIVMSDLIYVYTGDHNYGAEKDTSYYRECNSEGSCNIPFNDIAVATAFDNTIKEKYSIALSRMTEFINWHINFELKDWLVKALLEIIENDADVTSTDKFYILSSGKPLHISDIKQTTTFELQPFLLGILHYILSERREKNTYGKATLDTLGTKKTRKERRYNGNAGKTITRSIDVSLYEQLERSEPTNNITTDKSDISSPEAFESDDDVIISNLSKPLLMFADALAAQKHQMAEQIRQNRKKEQQAEVIDDTESSSAANDTAGSTKVIQQTIVNQYGDHPVNIGHVENLKL